MSDQDDEVQICLAHVQNGDQGACRQLVALLFPMVSRIVRAYRISWMDEEDIQQTIFSKMFSRIGQYQGQVPFPHWVSRIAVSTCLDILRHRKRRPELRYADLSESQAEFIENLSSHESAPDPARAEEARDLLHRLLASLPPQEHALLLHLDLEEQPLGKVAADLGISKIAAKVRAFRARQKLKSALNNLLQNET